MNASSSAKKASYFLLFADVKGFSKLDEHQFHLFSSEVMPRLAAPLDNSPPDYCNTWGDAIFAVYTDGEAAVSCALDLCECLVANRWTRLGLPEDLSIRVALHFGRCERGINPITKREEFLGHNVNLAARIEPIVNPNEVWATEKFVTALEPAVLRHIHSLPLGNRELVKGWGPQLLHRLSRYRVDPSTAKAGSYPSDISFPILGIHHINLPVTDLERSIRFYHDVLRLRQADDPEIMDPTKRRLPFKFPGAWFHLPNNQQLHLILTQPGDKEVTLRKTEEINFKDVHFALYVRDYDTTHALLADDPNVTITMGPMDCQFYIRDPDNHIIEITSIDGPQSKVR
jgi:glyoxylase I family protein